jgi:hypothetical protein
VQDAHAVHRHPSQRAQQWLAVRSAAP